MIEDYIGYDVTDIKLSLKDGKISVELGIDPKKPGPGELVFDRGGAYEPKWIKTPEILRAENECIVIQFHNAGSGFDFPHYTNEDLEFKELVFACLLSVKRINHKRPKKCTDGVEVYLASGRLFSVFTIPASLSIKRTKLETVILIGRRK